MKLKNFLILIIISLIVSLTPVIAVETGQTKTISIPDDKLDDIFRPIFEACDTEITVEQDQYLKAHEPLMIAKSESVMFNIGNYLNYLNNESSESKVSKRDNHDVFTRNLEKIMNELYQNYIPVSDTSCSYDELLYGVYNGTYNKDKIIVQIKDNGNYIRYVKLEDITSSTITLNIHRNSKSVNTEDFLSQYEDNRSEFNIIIVGGYETDRSDVIGSIIRKQRHDLDNELSKYNLETQFVTLIPGVSIGTLLTGIWRCSCFKPKNEMYLLKQDVREVPSYDGGGVELQGERSTLLHRLDSSPNFCQRHEAKIIIATGLTGAVGGSIGIIKLWSLKTDVENEKTNLDTY